MLYAQRKAIEVMVRRWKEGSITVEAAETFLKVANCHECGGLVLGPSMADVPEYLLGKMKGMVLGDRRVPHCGTIKEDGTVVCKGCLSNDFLGTTRVARSNALHKEDMLRDEDGSGMGGTRSDN